MSEPKPIEQPPEIDEDAIDAAWDSLADDKEK